MRTASLLCVVALAGCSDDAPSSKPTVDAVDTNVSPNKAIDWILVRHGTPELIKAGIISYAGVIAPEMPRTFTVGIRPLPSGGHAVEFDGKIPPYAFANLIGWLNDPPEIPNVSDAMGWYTSKSTDIRYCLRPDDDNAAGDTLVGAAQDGKSISVYLPELAVCELSSKIAYVADTDLVPQSGATVLSFDIVLDVDESFGNPDFELTHEMDARW